MRHESLYLTDIVEATDHIAEFIAGADFQAFQKSELLRYRGRPVWPRRTLQAQNSRNPLRCHATTVSGLTMHRAERHSSQTAQNQAHRNRSNRLSFGLFTECCSTPSWWRRAMISICNAARVRKALRLQSTAAKL